MCSSMIFSTIYNLVNGNLLTAPQKAFYPNKTGVGFPGGAVVESLPANAGDTGLSPGLGRSHMPRSD